MRNVVPIRNLIGMHSTKPAFLGKVLLQMLNEGVMVPFIKTVISIHCAIPELLVQVLLKMRNDKQRPIPNK